MDNRELTHWGIKGMRWGVRRYQNKDGSLTPAGKKRYDDEPDDPEAAKKAYEEGKQRAIKSGSASEVLKYQGDLTKAERDEAYNRLTWEQNMKGISDKETAVGKSKTEKFMDGLGKTTEYVNTAAKAWNTAANIINAFGGVNSVSLPKIDTNITSGNKKDRKAEKKEQKKAEEAAKKRQEQESQKESKRKERAEKKAKKESEEKASEKKTNTKENLFDGEVMGEGKSRANKFNSQTWKKGKSKADDIIDGSGLFKDITNDSSYSSTASSGRDFTSNYLNMPISGLLEEPK